MIDDKRLIEDYLPIEAISAEGSGEKNVRRGHISTLHLWWARRPLVACRAAVYGALVPAARFVPNGGSDQKNVSLGRANSAKFVKSLCVYPGELRTILEAQSDILTAHADRLTYELADWRAGNTPRPEWVDEFKFAGFKVTSEDISTGLAPRPRVLDMFAGGGSIPLEALRLGCEAYSVDINPVAYIIQLCTLVYPEKYGTADRMARGSTGLNNEAGEATWGGLADEVRYWGKWVLKNAKTEIGDLYPLMPDPRYKGGKPAIQSNWLNEHDSEEVPRGYLMPVAYLWTRTVRCKNPACGATVPLVRQTWLCKKKERYVALRLIAPKGESRPRFEVVEARTDSGLGFDPEAFSKRGNATCPFCGTVADVDYVKSEGWAGRMGQQMMSIVCTTPGRQGKTYVSADDNTAFIPHEGSVQRRIDDLCKRTGLTELMEPIANLPADSPDNSLGITVRPYGIRTWHDVFTPRQRLCLLSLCSAVIEAELEMRRRGYSPEHSKAVATGLACTVDKQADFNSAHCVLKADGGRGIVHTFGRHALSMVWDFAEANPFNEQIACWSGSLEEVVGNLEDLRLDLAASVIRGSALELPIPSNSLDAIITDPPYYDNVPYADISDFFFVWLKRSIGHLYPEHFAATLTPKKHEAIADAGRHNGNMEKAREAYERMMFHALAEAHRVLKRGGQLTVVYAHKTTLGWSTLVDALRRSGFTVHEAWPLDTETSGRLRAQNSAALASSIFLVARKRDPLSKIGNYEADVVPELGSIVLERVDTLWEMGISGADLVIACVGAGLRAFTKYASVEYSNGEEVAAGRFLAEVETVVLESILGKLSKTAGTENGQTSLAGLDPATRFYVLWRYTYGAVELDAGEAIIFANGTHVELEGLHGLSYGSRPLVERKKSNYRLLDYAERGDDAKLGVPSDDVQAPSLIDALHRLLWLMERQPSGIAEFLREAQPNTEQMRLVAQALAGPVLKGGELGEVATGSELAALTKLTANWRSVVEDSGEGPLFSTDRTGR